MGFRPVMNRIYNLLVNQTPGIRTRYQKKRNQVRGIGRIRVWIYLLALNIAYHVFRVRRLGELEKYPYYESKALYIEGSESSLSKRESPEKFADTLGEYDVISFDVFDTLIFRPFSEPTDLFFYVGDRLKYMDFKRIRMEMEARARERKYKQEGHYEVTIDEIYDVLSEETGIDREIGMKSEIELEYTYCFANPYMSRVVKRLRENGKRIIITSDMYLHTWQIKEILARSGYGEFDEYYVSCDIGKSKSKGNLYEYVKTKEDNEGRLRFVHVGDNEISDIKNAQLHGFKSIYYPNINQTGNQYRPEDMSSITGGIYRGLVNTHIHNGLEEYSREYEYGYIYGGLFVTGYCQFIHEYVSRHKPGRILFLARDGDVLLKAYKRLYPEEAGMCRYVYWSRLAATKMSAGYFKYDYFRRFLYHKINQGYSLKSILTSMEIEDMLQELCKDLTVNPDAHLTDRNVDKIKKWLNQNWKRVLEHYTEQLEAGKQYFSEILSGCKTAVAVDIGWAGSGAIALDYIVNHVWNMDCEITGIIAGTNTCHNAEPDTSETFLQSGRLVSYMYSQRENRDLWKFHDPGKMHNLYWEMLLDAPHGSLKGFYLDEQRKWRCEFKSLTANRQKTEEVQNGILDYVAEYINRIGSVDWLGTIHGRDAYAPMILVENVKNKKIVKKICGIIDTKNIE